MGFEEGEAQAGARFERELTAEREAIAKAVHDFAREREGYFCRVEAEVVKLAVEIARKILHREVQVDPLLLAGVVRVALEKISAGTSVRLRVHPDHVYAWHDFFANQQDHRPVPELLGDATLGMGHCVLETALGTTDLTLEAQLAEIERGFFDLLAQRPGDNLMDPSTQLAPYFQYLDTVLHVPMVGPGHQGDRPPGRIGRSFLLCG